MRADLDVLVLPAFTDLPGLPGERDPWLEAYDLGRSLAVDGVPEPLHWGPAGLGVVPTGVGKSAAATTTTALLASDRVDLSGALVLSVGVAGGPPTEVTVGSVVLADAVVDWDNKLRLAGDAGSGSRLEPNPYNEERAVYRTDGDLLAWATDLAVGVGLDGADGGDGSGFEDRMDPEVVVGTNLCGDELWHGTSIADSAQKVVDAYGGGTYCVTEMEDLGTALALDRFDRLEQYLSVRGVANFDRPAPDQSVADSFFGDSFEAGFPVALGNAVAVGTTLVDDWTGR